MTDATAQADTQPESSCLDRRRAGILLHITSLPGPSDCGDLGREARHFVDFLAAAGIGLWQTLPIGPTHADGSPYQTRSVYAGSPRLISLDPLVEKGWLAAQPESFSEQHKQYALRLAWRGFRDRAGAEDRQALAQFTRDQRFWLEDYTLFEAIGEEMAACWWRRSATGAAALPRERGSPFLLKTRFTPAHCFPP